MRLIGLAVVLAVSLGLAPLAGEAQPTTKVPRVGVLAPAEPSTDDPVLAGFTISLRELGYVDGRNITVEYLYAHGQTDRFPDLAADLHRRNVDVAVVGSTRAALATKDALKTTPIVFVGASDPVTIGLVTSMARPGGNVTGLSFAFEEGLGGKLMELLHEAVPQATRIAILRDAAYPTATGSMSKDMDRASQAFHLKLRRFNVHGASGLTPTFEAIAKAGVQALVVEPVPFFNTHQRTVVQLSGRHRLPGMYSFRSFVDAGGLMSYGVSLTDLWRRSARYVDISKHVGRVNSESIVVDEIAA
jgi:putative ABC transport system substrate-binding protein